MLLNVESEVDLQGYGFVSQEAEMYGHSDLSLEKKTAFDLVRPPFFFSIIKNEGKSNFVLINDHYWQCCTSNHSVYV